MLAWPRGSLTWFNGVVLLPDNWQTPLFSLCCDCGAQIQPNPTNRCIACIRARNDITKDINKQCTLHFCRACERYLDPPNTWITAPLESKELLKLCLRKIRGLNKVRLVDAGFAWTEPHSKRIKVLLCNTLYTYIWEWGGVVPLFSLGGYRTWPWRMYFCILYFWNV